ncbi:hypothetical protein Caferm_00385 [Corynebacterium afermentans subsp. afermentans]|nr:hypothetical protein Caferm_00385 [Corynebacterium afermentans subsp. afermentans]RUQ12943.1 hypothetical protein D8M31_05675 [Corynebacterium genitalium]
MEFNSIPAFLKVWINVIIIGARDLRSLFPEGYRISRYLHLEVAISLGLVDHFVLSLYLVFNFLQIFLGKNAFCLAINRELISS